MSLIITAQHLKEVPLHVKDLMGTMVFVDVDDTLITPCALACRGAGNIIDAIKNELKGSPRYEQVLSFWRANRKTQLLEKDAPGFIRDLPLKHGAIVYALTQVHTGLFGGLDMEKWRAGELKSHGITFHPAFAGAYKHRFDKGVFYNGLFMTPTSKVELLNQAFAKSGTYPRGVVMIDDKLEQLQAMEGFLGSQGVRFTGIHYRGIDRHIGQVNPQVAALQKKRLLDPVSPCWLEDETAQAALSSTRG